MQSFDELVLLKRGGRLIYAGPTGHNSEDLVKYFEGIQGVSRIKEGINPATCEFEADEGRHGVLREPPGYGLQGKRAASLHHICLGSCRSQALHFSDWPIPFWACLTAEGLQLGALIAKNVCSGMHRDHRLAAVWQGGKALPLQCTVQDSAQMPRHVHVWQ